MLADFRLDRPCCPSVSRDGALPHRFLKTPAITRLIPAILVLCALLAACENTTPATGPQGPAGPTGPRGPAGPALDVSAFETTIRASSFRISTSGRLASISWTVPEITSSVAASGIVLCYYRPWLSTSQQLSDLWYLLPDDFAECVYAESYVSFSVSSISGNVRSLISLYDRALLKVVILP